MVLYLCSYGLAASQSVYDEYKSCENNTTISKCYPTKSSRRRNIRDLNKAKMAKSASKTISKLVGLRGWLFRISSELATRPGPKGTGTTTIPSHLARLTGIRRPAKRMTARRGLLGCGGAACARLVRLFIIQLRSGNVSEPLSADPHAEWCGGLGS